MNIKNIVFSVLFVFLVGCASQQTKQLSSNENSQISKEEQLLNEGYKLLSQNSTKQAINVFDRVIELCANQYDNKENQYYGVRTQIEIIYYMAMAAVEKKNAIATSLTCGDALYLKGYAVLDMAKAELAAEYLKRAVKMSPVNSMYLSELAHIYQVMKQWDKAYATFEEAEIKAETFSPTELKDKELSRAKRGMGFVLIELGKLDEAEAKFRECLEINAEDSSALNELSYIKGLREKNTGQ